MDNLSPNIKKCLKTTYMLFGLGGINMYQTWWKRESILSELYRESPENIEFLARYGYIIRQRDTETQFTVVYALNPDKLKEYMDD